MARHNVWMSVSDLMTGLMVIFLFIAIAYISKVNTNQTVLRDFVETKQKLHNELVNEFKGDADKWKMIIGGDLTMKFDEPSVLFASGSSELTPRFKEILDEFLPRYFNILLDSDLRSKIEAIRIEGHTDDVPIPSRDPDPYLANVKLSQERAANVLKYFLNSDAFKNYTPERQALLRYWITTNGLSYGKPLNRYGEDIVPLDDNGDACIPSDEMDKAKSRRVEFRIVTYDKEILEDFVKKL